MLAVCAAALLMEAVSSRNAASASLVPCYSGRIRLVSVSLSTEAHRLVSAVDV